MPVIKNKSTAENRAFWDHVEAIAQTVRCRDASYETVTSGSSKSSSENARPRDLQPAEQHATPKPERR